VVRNEYIGVNFIDSYFRSGLYPRPSFPSGLGEEGAGTVEAVGPGEPFHLLPLILFPGLLIMCINGRR
jgi:NADPH2:quinone reductase